MAGRQVSGEAIPPSLAGMSKNQLYDIMSQMKTLIEQNRQQARQILIQNPALTKALFQAQIMLGMVQPQQAAPAVTAPATSKQQPMVASNFQSQSVATSNPPSMPSHPSQLQQPKGNLGALSAALSLPPPPQVPNQLPQHVASQPASLLQPTTQLQQPMQTTGSQYLPARPPLQGYPHQAHAQVAPSVGFQHSGPQLHPSQHTFRPGTKSPGGLGASFPTEQLPLPNQPLSQSAYQTGSPHLGMEFNQAGMTKPTDRLTTWPPSLQESNIGGQLPPPPPYPAPAGPSSQLPRSSAQLTPELEKALLQQVMSLTPEQINMLPPDQRNQILQLQQALRQ